jgi:exosome complex component RRP4
MDKEGRQIVIPGETIVKGKEFLPGESVYREGEEVIAKRFGIVEISEKHVRVIPISGAYYPRRGNTIIGTIVDITFNGWLIDFGGVQNAFLPVAEVPRYINKNELREYLDFGESVIVKVWDVKSRGVDVSMKMRGYGKLEGGMIISVNPNKVPRIIGKEGSMVKLIKNATRCEITVGQNGKVWISGSSTEEEIATKKIIEFIVENATINGLTEKVEKYIKNLKIKGNIEIVAEDTDKEGEQDG